jgi:hypothetical protein
VPALDKLLAGVYIGDDRAGFGSKAAARSTTPRPPLPLELLSNLSSKDRAGLSPRRQLSTGSVSSLASFRNSGHSGMENALKRVTFGGPPAGPASPAQPKIVSLTSRNLHLKEAVDRVNKRSVASRPESFTMHGIDDDEMDAERIKGV